MYKGLKIFILLFLIIFLCSYITYSIEPAETTLNSSAPESAPAPAAESLPVPESPEEAVPSPVLKQQEAEAPDEAKQQAASDFNKKVEEIVIKRINLYYKNGGRGTIGIYIKELNTGFEYAFNGEKTNPDNPDEGYFNSASTCKLLSAAVMYYMNDCGELELDRVYTDEITKSKYNLKYLLSRMISHSVNDYFNITLRHLGSEKINETLMKLGTRYSIVYSEIMPAQGTSAQNNIKRYGISKSPRTTPKDLGHVLDLLYCGRTFGADNDKLLLEALKSNIYSNRLPAGIGYRSPVAHKTGTSPNEGVYNDAGIIFLRDNPYIMVVMSKDSGSSVQSLYRTITGEIYEFMKKRTETQSSS